MYIKRKIEDDILGYLERPEIIAIVGPRQCGKTTTLKKVYETLPKAVFLTFEDQQILSLFEQNIKGFAAIYLADSRYLIIDEFQYAKKGGKNLKYLYDQYPKTKLIISGSSAIDLTVQALKFLVGRIFILPMYAFDFAEYLAFRDANLKKTYDERRLDLAGYRPKDGPLAPVESQRLRDCFEEFAVWGGYPQVVISAGQKEKVAVLKNIYATYFLREVKGILGLIDDFMLNKLIQGLALQIGQMTEYRELSQLSEFSQPTVKKYLNFLSKTYIAEFVRPYYSNKRTEIVKNKKVYFHDPGLRNAIINDFRPLEKRPDSGELLENAIWAQLVKRGLSPQYWRDKNKNEVDFVIDLGERRLAALEVKYRQAKCRSLPLAFTKAYPEIKAYCGYLLPAPDTGQTTGQIFLPLL